MDLNKEIPSVQAAVIVLHERSTQCLILTKRSPHLRRHPGELCFPGGVWEEQDDSFYATALRELYEELGIESKRLHLIKALTVEHTRLGSIIHPWLARIDLLEPVCINPQEVDSIIRVPISLVKNPNNYEEIIINRDEVQFKSCKFTGHSEFIWGATARIMKQLI
jgi:8-oxo-dGTP pyrophosphatase MutT (NUDIX family)